MKIFTGPIKIYVMMLVFVKQNGIINHKKVTLGGSTEYFTTNDGFRSQCLCKILYGV